MTCPVMYDLNRHLAAEAREEARDERLEAICAEVREETEECLMHSSNAEAMMDDVAGFFDQKKLNEALVAAFRGKPEAHDMLVISLDDAIGDYVKSVASARLRHLEEVEAEDAALARAGVC